MTKKKYQHADRVVCSYLEEVAHHGLEGLVGGVAKRVAVEVDLNVRIPVDELEALFEAPHAADQALQDVVDDAARIFGLVGLPLHIHEDGDDELANGNDHGAKSNGSQVVPGKTPDSSEVCASWRRVSVASLVPLGDASGKHKLVARREESQAPQAHEKVPDDERDVLCLLVVPGVTLTVKYLGLELGSVCSRKHDGGDGPCS